MKKLGIVLALLLLLASHAFAQDWQDDDGTGSRYDCDLVRELIAEYGDQDFLQTSPNSFATLATFLDTLFPKCLEKTADADSASETAAESDPGTTVAIQVEAELKLDKMYPFHDACLITLSDEDSSDLNIYIASHRHESISVAVYLPGETEPAPIASSDIHDMQGLPYRIDHVDVEELPAGRYTIDMTVDEDVYRFEWLRALADHASVIVSCVGEEGPTVLPQLQAEYLRKQEVAQASKESASAADPEIEVFAELEADSVQILDNDCFIILTDRFDTPFNVSVAGNGLDMMSIDVFLPAESEPAAIAATEQDELSSGLPVRIEWLAADHFPPGKYVIDAHIGEESYRLEWLRDDDLDYTIMLSCVRVQDFEDAAEWLEDGGIVELQEVDCRIWTDTFDEDMNIVVAAEDPEAIEVDLFFPGASIPEKTDGVERDEFEDGIKYRAEWIVGDSFPLGGYTITVHIDGKSHQVIWEREDDAYNLIFVHCEGIGEDAES